MGVLRRQSQEMDTAGTPLAGAKLHTYEAGTTTNKATYSDDGLAIPLPNPVVADGSGRFPAIYGERAADKIDYKLVLKTSAGVTIWASDNVSPAELMNESTATRFDQLTSNPLKHGAAGDGVANDSAALNAAVVAATANGVVDLLGLTYRCDTTVFLRSGVTLKNGKLDFSNCNSDEFLNLHPATSGGLNLPITVDVAYGDGQVTATGAAGLSAGEMISIFDSSSYIDGTVQRGELHEVESVVGDVVKLQSPAQDIYTQASNARCFRQPVFEDITIEDVVITGTEGIAGTHEMISARQNRRLTLRNVTMKGIDSRGLYLASCSDVVVTGCSFSDGEHAIVLANGVSDVKISSCHFSGLVRGVSFGDSTMLEGSQVAAGIQRDVLVTDSTFFVSPTVVSQAIMVGPFAKNVTFSGNRVIGGGALTGATVIVDCANAAVSDNDLASSPGVSGYAIEMKTEVPNRVLAGARVLVSGNFLSSTAGGMLTYLPGKPSGGCGVLDRLEVTGNSSAGGHTAFDVYIDTNSFSLDSPDILSIGISDNDFSGKIAVTTINTGSTVGDVTVTGGTCLSLLINGVTGTRIQSVSVAGVSTDGVDVQNAVRATLSGLAVQGGLSVMSVDNLAISGCAVSSLLVQEAAPEVTKSCSIAGCSINAASGQAVSLFFVNGGGGVVFSGNRVLGTLPGSFNVLDISSCIGLVISDNVLERLDDIDDNISLSNVSGAVISGNYIKNGTFGIGDASANCSDVRAFGNIFSSISSSNKTIGIVIGDTMFALGLPNGATTFLVSSKLMQVSNPGAGGCTISTITGGHDGMELTLVFSDSNITITDTAGHAADTVDLSAAFTSVDDAVLRLVHDGTSWYEVSRSIN